MTDLARQERCIHPEVGIMTGLGGKPNRWFCGQCNFEFVPIPSVSDSDAVCSGCHTRACNGDCMRPMRFKGDAK